MEHCHLGLLSTNAYDFGLVLWPVRELDVIMNECSLNLGQLLKLLLQRLADVVRLAQRHVPRQHDVDLHEVVRTEGVRPHCVDVPYLLVVVPDQVHQLCQVLHRRRLANQRPHVVQYRTCPGSGRVQSNMQFTIHLLSFYLLE
jgi:hypothetical protein